MSVLMSPIDGGLVRILKNCWYMLGWTSELDCAPQFTRMVAEEAMIADKVASGALVVRGDGGRQIVVVARHRIIWIWPGDATKADPSRIPDFSSFDNAKENAFFSGYLHTRANYELMTDNILDLSHADFLHPSSLGGIFNHQPSLQRVEDNLILTWENTTVPAIPNYNRLMPEPGKPAHSKITVTWYPASAMKLRSQAAPANEPLEEWFDIDSCHIMTPQDEFHTHYFYARTRNYKEDDPEFNSAQAQVFAQAFSTEDKPVIEAQQRAMGTAEFWSLKPVLLPIDIGGVQARRTLARLIQEEAAAIT